MIRVVMRAVAVGMPVAVRMVMLIVAFMFHLASNP
jgi:hypothetical protein